MPDRRQSEKAQIKRRGSSLVKIHRQGDGRYVVAWTERGRRYWRPYKTRAKAERIADEVLKRKERGVSCNFGPAEESRFFELLEKCQGAGCDIGEAVEKGIEALGRLKSPPTNEIVEQLLESKSDHKLSARYMRGLSGDLRHFAQCLPHPIAAIRSGHVEKYLRSLGVGDRRRNNVRDEIVTLFLFARDRGFLAAGQTTEAEKVARIKLDHDAPGIYTPSQLRVILEHVRKEWLPWIVIGAFAGIRPEEIALWHTTKKGARHKLTWSDFHWDERQIKVSRFISKTKHDRYVPISDTLLAWLEPWRDARGHVCPEERPDRETERLGKMIGFPWIPDGLRHSFGSYWQSLNRNIEKLAEIMGNSIPIIRRHYYNPRLESDARKWFAVLPDLEGKILQMPLAMSFGKK